MIMMLFFLALALMIAHALYWIIRLAVRHGVQDASVMRAGRDAPQTKAHQDLDGTPHI